MRIVLDTNVLISGMINPDGTPAQILNLLINGKLTLLYDNRVMKEYEEVLIREKFAFGKDRIAPLLDYIRDEGEYVTAEPSGENFKDYDDRMFYEVAFTGKAACVITGNKDHYPDEEMITNPKEFIERHLAGNEEQSEEAT